MRRAGAPGGLDVAVGLGSLANRLLDAGNLDAAEAAFREALALDLALGNQLAIDTGNLADIHLARQDWPAAEAQARQALALSQAVQRVDIIGADHHRLAQALLAQSRAAEALPHAREAALVFERLHHRELREAPATLAACEATLGGTKAPG